MMFMVQMWYVCVCVGLYVTYVSVCVYGVLMCNEVRDPYIRFGLSVL